MEIWFLWWNKTEFFPSCVYVSSSIWMHHLETNEMLRKKLGTAQALLYTVLNKSWQQHYPKLTVKTTKRIVNANKGPPGFSGQWQCCPGHLAVPKYPNPKYWSITGTTPTPLLTSGFHSYSANPLQAIPWMGSGGTTPWGNAPPPLCKNSRKV